MFFYIVECESDGTRDYYANLELALERSKSRAEGDVKIFTTRQGSYQVHVCEEQIEEGSYPKLIDVVYNVFKCRINK